MCTPSHIEENVRKYFKQNKKNEQEIENLITLSIFRQFNYKK